MAAVGSCCVHCERVDEMHETLADLRVSNAEMCGDVASILQASTRIEAAQVSKEAFWPVKTLVYGAVGAVGLAFISGLAALLWNSR